MRTTPEDPDMTVPWGGVAGVLLVMGGVALLGSGGGAVVLACWALGVVSLGLAAMAAIRALGRA